MTDQDDMEDCEYRNEFGRPWASNGSAVVNSPVDNSVNKPMPWIVLSAIMASLALMGTLMMPMIIDAKVKAGLAEANAKAELALKTAYTAKDQIDYALAKQSAKEKP